MLNILFVYAILYILYYIRILYILSQEEGGIYYKKLAHRTSNSSSDTGTTVEGTSTTEISPHDVLVAECQEAVTSFYPGFKKRYFDFFVL